MTGTVVDEGVDTKLIRWVGLPAGCAVVVWLLKLAAGWLLTLRWVPFQGPLELIDSIPEPAATLGALGIGLIIGTLLALTAHSESLTVTVADDQVTLTDGENRTSTFPRDQVSAVFRDKSRLVLLGPDTNELARKTHDLNVARLADAFRAHGYPWTDTDPHAERYRRWVPDMPGLPAGANALFTAREKADSDDSRELRSELAKLGVLVRDDKGKQYWRLAE
jgi:hypothetical protein